MAKISFNDLDAVESATSSNNNPGSDIGFFTLKNDGDEAIVRFMCDSVDDFDIQMVHSITLANHYRKVACLRTPREPLDMCPMCAAGTQVSARFFIRMLVYTKVADPQTGNTLVVPKAMIWERSTNYAKTLKSYLDNYGPLSDVICKIIRHGAAGDMKTTYEIVPNLSKQIYRDDLYVKDPSMFGTFETLGTIVMKKDAAEMSQFLATGMFPEKPKSDVPPAAPTATPAQAPSYPTYNTTPAPASSAYAAPAQPMSAPDTESYAPQQPAFDPNRVTPRTSFGGAEAAPAFERPRRF